MDFSKTDTVKLRNYIQTLDTVHHICIAKIINKYDPNLMSESSNGLFINLSTIDNELRDQIAAYLEQVPPSQNT